MNNAPIYMTREDHAILRRLVTTALYSPSRSAVEKLCEELDRAIVVDSVSIPPGVVTMDATIEFEDLHTGEVEHTVITLPERADAEEKRVSILAPIGTGLIGCREGNLVKWTTPDGIRHLRIRRVAPSSADVAPESFASSVHFH
jgi:regulator of nucleoside diphosphate kinase